MRKIRLICLLFNQGYGFITFSNEKEANEAVRCMDKQPFQGRVLQVSIKSWVQHHVITNTTWWLDARIFEESFCFENILRFISYLYIHIFCTLERTYVKPVGSCLFYYNVAHCLINFTNFNTTILNSTDLEKIYSIYILFLNQNKEFCLKLLILILCSKFYLVFNSL